MIAIIEALITPATSRTKNIIKAMIIVKSDNFFIFAPYKHFLKDRPSIKPNHALYKALQLNHEHFLHA